jgi:rhomboid family GlyGly-CTERM serine protease
VPARRDWRWLALLCLASALLPEQAAVWLEYRREAVISGEVWRLVSGHLVHFSPRHALLDGTALAALAYALHRLDASKPLWPRLAVSAVAMSLFLAAMLPNMISYRGASGLAMVLAGMLLRTLWALRPAWRPGLAAFAALLCSKMLLDVLGWTADSSVLPAGVQITWQAHAAGLALGLWPEKLSGRAAT